MSALAPVTPADDPGLPLFTSVTVPTCVDVKPTPTQLFAVMHPTESTTDVALTSFTVTAASAALALAHSTPTTTATNQALRRMTDPPIPAPTRVTAARLSGSQPTVAHPVVKSL